MQPMACSTSAMSAKQETESRIRLLYQTEIVRHLLLEDGVSSEVADMPLKL